MKKAVKVSLRAEERGDLLVAPGWPVVAGKEDLGTGAEELDRLIDALRPPECVADLCPTTREDVVQHLRRCFNDAEGASLWQEEVELGRGLGLGNHLELKQDAIDSRLLAGLGDLVGYRHQRRSTGRNPLADRHIDLPARPARKV